MRSVTTKPPTTLTVPKMMPIRPSASWSGESAVAVTMIAPTTTTPWIALAPDMSGVWSMVGTLLTTS